jgi:hypothetical protein
MRTCLLLLPLRDLVAAVVVVGADALNAPATDAATLKDSAGAPSRAARAALSANYV